LEQNENKEGIRPTAVVGKSMQYRGSQCNIPGARESHFQGEMRRPVWLEQREMGRECKQMDLERSSQARS
jgi:hypothetical protein